MKCTGKAIQADRLTLALFVIKNMEIFTPKSDIHTKNTRNKFNLFLLQTRLTKYQKGVYFAGTKIFNYLSYSHSHLFHIPLILYRRGTSHVYI